MAKGTSSRHFPYTNQGCYQKGPKHDAQKEMTQGCSTQPRKSLGGVSSQDSEVMGKLEGPRNDDPDSAYADDDRVGRDGEWETPRLRRAQTGQIQG